ncbi:hypothetical protein Bca4012_018838 [Brassica carinata]
MSSPTFLSVAGTLPLVTGKPSSLIFKRSKAVNTLVSYYLWLGREVSIPSGLRGTTDSTETTTALQLPSSPRLTTSLGGGLHHSGSPIHRFLLSFSTLGSRLFRTIDDNKASRLGDASQYHVLVFMVVLPSFSLADAPCVRSALDFCGVVDDCEGGIEAIFSGLCSNPIIYSSRAFTGRDDYSLQRSSLLEGGFFSRIPSPLITMSLVANEEFQHILRVLNTNVDGKQKIMFALTSIKGIGRRLANIVCKKADVDMNKRAGELSAAEIDNLMTIVANPKQYKIPDWFLNRQKDYKDGKYSQVVSNALDMKLRDDLERLKKIRNHRGLRHYWGLRVRGQHTKTTGRRGKTVGVSKKR